MLRRNGVSELTIQIWCIQIQYIISHKWCQKLLVYLKSVTQDRHCQLPMQDNTWWWSHKIILTKLVVVLSISNCTYTVTMNCCYVTYNYLRTPKITLAVPSYSFTVFWYYVILKHKIHPSLPLKCWDKVWTMPLHPPSQAFLIRWFCSCSDGNVIWIRSWWQHVDSA